MATKAASIRTGSLRETAHDVDECFAEHGLLAYAPAIAFRALVALVPLTLLGLALEDVWADTIAAVLVQSVAPAIAARALDAFLSVLRWPVAVLFLWAAVTLLLRYAPAENRDLRWARQAPCSSSPRGSPPRLSSGCGSPMWRASRARRAA